MAYFQRFAHLLSQAMIGSECVGAIVCKLDLNRKAAKRGYIAMLAVDGKHRNKGIGKVCKSVLADTCFIFPF